MSFMNELVFNNPTLPIIEEGDEPINLLKFIKYIYY